MQQLILGVLVQLDDQLCLKIHLLVYIEKPCLLSRGCLAMVFNLPQGMSTDKLGELHPAAAAEFRPFGLRILHLETERSSACLHRLFFG